MFVLAISANAQTTPDGLTKKGPVNMSYNYGSSNISINSIENRDTTGNIGYHAALGSPVIKQQFWTRTNYSFTGVNSTNPLVLNRSLYLGTYAQGDTGKVGINTNSPGSTLDVNGNLTVRNITFSEDSAHLVSIGTGGVISRCAVRCEDVRWTTGSGSNTILKQLSDYVAIGHDDPEANLDVLGSIKFRDGNEADGYIWTSDSDGFGNWKPSNIATFIEVSTDSFQVQPGTRIVTVDVSSASLDIYLPNASTSAGIFITIRFKDDSGGANIIRVNSFGAFEMQDPEDFTYQNKCNMPFTSGHRVCSWYSDGVKWNVLNDNG